MNGHAPKQRYGVDFLSSFEECDIYVDSAHICIYIYIVKEIMNPSEILYIAEIRKKHSTRLLVLYSNDNFYCGNWKGGINFGHNASNI